MPSPHYNSRMRRRTAFHPEAFRLFAAMTTEPTDARKIALNEFIMSLKQSGVWDKLVVIQLYAAHTTQAARLNVRLPGTFDASLTGSLTFTADRGYTSNGTNSFVGTGIAPNNAALSQNSICFGVRSLTSGQMPGSNSGFFGSDGITLNHRNTSDDPGFRINQAAQSSNAMTLTTAATLFVANRSASNATQLYIDGVEQSIGTNANQTSTAPGATNLRVGSSGSSAFVAFEFASCYVGPSLSAIEHAALHAADLKYMQAVGAVA